MEDGLTVDRKMISRYGHSFDEMIQGRLRLWNQLLLFETPGSAVFMTNMIVYGHKAEKEGQTKCSLVSRTEVIDTMVDGQFDTGPYIFIIEICLLLPINMEILGPFSRSLQSKLCP